MGIKNEDIKSMELNNSYQLLMGTKDEFMDDGGKIKKWEIKPAHNMVARPKYFLYYFYSNLLFFLSFVAVAPNVKTRTISLCLRLGSREINGVNCPFAEARRHSHFSPMFSSPFRVERRSFTSASRFTRLSTLERA